MHLPKFKVQSSKFRVQCLNFRSGIPWFLACSLLASLLFPCSLAAAGPNDGYTFTTQAGLSTIGSPERDHSELEGLGGQSLQG